LKNWPKNTVFGNKKSERFLRVFPTSTLLKKDTGLVKMSTLRLGKQMTGGI